MPTPCQSAHVLGTKYSYHPVNAQIVINVLDVNDNAPVMDAASYSFSLAENIQDNTALFSVSATDADAGINAQITFAIAPFPTPPLPFRINNVTGELVKEGAIDFDLSLQQYTFTVVATDGGNPSLQGTSQVTMIITDVNDNNPIFVNTSFDFTLPRTQLDHVELATVVALDADSGVNAEVEYTLVAESLAGFFSVNSTTGAVALEGALCGPSAFSRTDLLVIITASDRGVPSLSVAPNGSARIRVNIADNNTHAPSFNETGYSATIPSTTAPGSIVVVATAHDVVDSACEISSLAYSILPGSDGAFFAVDRLNGTITTSRALPPSGGLRFTLQVDDSGLPSAATATVDIVVAVWFDDADTASAIFRDFTLSGSGFLVGNSTTTTTAGFERPFLMTPSYAGNQGSSITAHFAGMQVTRTLQEAAIPVVAQVKMVSFEDALWESDSRVRVALQAFSTTHSAEVQSTQLYVRVTPDAALAAIGGVPFYEGRCTVIGAAGQNVCFVTVPALPSTFFDHTTLDPSREYGVQLSFGVVGGTDVPDRRLPLRRLSDVTYTANDVVLTMDPRGVYAGQSCVGEVWASTTHDVTA